MDGNSEYFGAGVAKGAAGIGCAAGDGGGSKREDETGRISEHVARIGDECERPGKEPGEALDDNERSGERESGDERAARAFVSVRHDSMVAPGGRWAGRWGKVGARVEGAAAAAVRATPWQVNSQA